MNGLLDALLHSEDVRMKVVALVGALLLALIVHLYDKWTSGK